MVISVRSITRDDNRYVTGWIRNADAGSAFTKKTRWISWLPEWTILLVLKWCRYGGMVCHRDGKITGHAFFQCHREALHLFSVYVTPECRSQGVAKEILRAFVIHAKATPGITRVRIGAGTNPTITRVINKIVSEEIPLPFKVSAGTGLGWIEFQ